MIHDWTASFCPKVGRRCFPICAVNEHWECSVYLWRDIKSLSVPHTQAGSGSQGWILLAASSHLSLFKYDGPPADRSTGEGSFRDIRGQQGGTILECLLKQLCGTSLPTGQVLPMQPTALEGSTRSSLVLVYWMCSQLHVMWKRSCLFLVFPIFPGCYLSADSHNEGCPGNQCPCCCGAGSVCSTLGLSPSHWSGEIFILASIKQFIIFNVVIPWDCL